MADDKGGQEKTENATPKRLREARKKGQVPKSRDLTTVLVLIATISSLAAFGSMIVSEIEKFSISALSLEFFVESNPLASIFALSEVGFLVLMRACAPFLIAAFVSAAVIGRLQVGGVFSFEPLKPELKKLNAIEGIKKMFKAQTFIELVKNIIKMVVILGLAYAAIDRYLRPFLLTTTVPIADGAKIGGKIVLYFLVLVFIVFILVAIIDVMLQRREFKKNLKMTKEEVKREYKEDEGDPLIKSKRKQMHQEMAMSDVAQQVKASDVVVTNPTHIAIAIKYDQAEMVSPQIMAKGQRLFAQTIREIAAEYDVPIMRNVPLAWTLIELEVGDEIPEDLYRAVAEVLAFVYRLKAERDRAAYT